MPHRDPISEEEMGVFIIGEKEKQAFRVFLAAEVTYEGMGNYLLISLTNADWLHFG